MNGLMQIAKEFGKYQIGLDELGRIGQAWRGRKSIADLARNAAAPAIDFTTRYAGLATQVAVLSAAYAGNMQPSDAAGWTLVTEMGKLIVHAPIDVMRTERELKYELKQRGHLKRAYGY